MVEVLVQPEILPADAESAGRIGKPEVQGHRAEPPGQSSMPSRAVDPAARQQMLISVQGARIRDDDGSKAAGAIPDLDADGFSVLDDDLLDILAQSALPTVQLDDGFDQPGDAGSAALRIVRSFQVVIDDEGMDGECALRRRQPVVTPLACQDRAEPFRCDSPREICARCLQGPFPAQEVDGANPETEIPRDKSNEKITDMPACSPPDVTEVLPDGPCFLRERDTRFPAYAAGSPGSSTVSPG